MMLNIIKHLDRKRFNIYLLTTVRTEQDWADAFVPYTDKIIHVPELFSKSWSLGYHARFIEKFVKSVNADVFFITNSVRGYIATKKIKQNNPNIRIYDLLHTHGTKWDDDAYLKLSMPYDKYINRRIVIDDYLKQYYVNKYPVDSDKVCVIYNGIDKNDSTNHSKSVADNLFDTQLKKLDAITYMGRLEADKSPQRLVDIAIAINERHLPVAIVAVGDGTLRQEMTQKAKKTKVLNKNLFFYGQSDKPINIFKKSKFSILVSDNEGIPMSVLESMSVGTPAIAPAVGGIPEMIDNGKDGYLVDINNQGSEYQIIKAFVDTISQARQLTTNQYKEMQKKAVQKVSDRFSNMGKIYSQLFETGKIE